MFSFTNSTEISDVPFILIHLCQMCKWEFVGVNKGRWESGRYSAEIFSFHFIRWMMIPNDLSKTLICYKKQTMKLNKYPCELFCGNELQLCKRQCPCMWCAVCANVPSLYSASRYLMSK